MPAAQDGNIESESIQNQKSLLLQYAGDIGWEIYRIYTDEDYSGADRDRPAFRRLILDAESGCFEVVLCKTQSRFTRDMELVEKYIHNLFPQWGVRFVALLDHADTDVKGNKKARQINGLVNEWYLEDLSENIKAVLDNKRKNGKFIGSFPAYGYRKDPSDRNHLMIDAEAADVVRNIFGLAAAGYGKQRIADHLNAQGIPNPTKYKELKGYSYVNGAARLQCGRWNRTTVGRILENEMYTGTLVQGRRRKASYKSPRILDVPREDWIRVDGTHEAIIDKGLFCSLQSRPAIRKRRATIGNPSLLSGKVRCRVCGSVMGKTTAIYKGVRHSYLRCGNCSRHTIRYDMLEELVTVKLEEYLERYCGGLLIKANDNEKAEGESAEEIQNRKGLLENKIGQYTSAIENLYVDKASGVLDQDSFSDLLISMMDKKRELLYELKEADKRLGEMNDLAVKGSIIPDAVRFLISTIEVSKKDPLSHEQEVLINWLF